MGIVAATVVAAAALFMFMGRNDGTSDKAAVRAATHTIAVLPFVNMSPDPDQEYFSDGISEELLNLLARIPDLRVAARTSSFSFKGRDVGIPEIAKRLNVAYVLEGSVRKVGNQVRVTAQLIQGADGFHVSSATYDRTLDDIFAIQDEIAADVVKQLKITLLGNAPTSRKTNPEAYALYLQSVQLGRRSTRDGFEKSDALLRRALEIDAAYAPAWAGLAANFGNKAVSGQHAFQGGICPRPRGKHAGTRDRSAVCPGARRTGLCRDVRRQRLCRRGEAPGTRVCPGSGECARAGQQRHAAQPSRPEERGARTAESHHRPRPGEHQRALQSGHQPNQRRPARRGGRILPYRAEPEPWQRHRALPDGSRDAAQGRRDRCARGVRAGARRGVPHDRPADGLPRARAEGGVRRRARRS